MRENINEHDMTKKMMDIIRNGHKGLIKEASFPNEDEQNPTEPSAPNQVTDKPEESDDTISPVSGDAVFNDELKKLQDTVDKSVEITNFKIYPSDRNVMIEGTFLRSEQENSGISFTMALTARDVKIEVIGQTDLDDDISLLLQKLKGYYKGWCDEWYIKMGNEYRPEKEDEK